MNFTLTKELNKRLHGTKLSSSLSLPCIAGLFEGLSDSMVPPRAGDGEGSRKNLAHHRFTARC